MATTEASTNASPLSDVQLLSQCISSCATHASTASSKDEYLSRVNDWIENNSGLLDVLSGDRISEFRRIINNNAAQFNSDSPGAPQLRNLAAVNRILTLCVQSAADSPDVETLFLRARQYFHTHCSYDYTNLSLSGKKLLDSTFADSEVAAGLLAGPPLSTRPPLGTTRHSRLSGKSVSDLIRAEEFRKARSKTSDASASFVFFDAKDDFGHSFEVDPGSGLFSPLQKLSLLKHSPVVADSHSSSVEFSHSLPSLASLPTTGAASPLSSVPSNLSDKGSCDAFKLKPIDSSILTTLQIAASMLPSVPLSVKEPSLLERFHAFSQEAQLVKPQWLIICLPQILRPYSSGYSWLYAMFGPSAFSIHSDHIDPYLYDKVLAPLGEDPVAFVPYEISALLPYLPTVPPHEFANADAFNLAVAALPSEIAQRLLATFAVRKRGYMHTLNVARSGVNLAAVQVARAATGFQHTAAAVAASSQQLMDEVKTTATGVKVVAQELGSEVKQAAESVTASTKSLFESFKAHLDNLSKGVKSTFEWTQETFMSMLTSPCRFVKHVFEWIFSSGASMVSRVVSLLQDSILAFLLAQTLIAIIGYHITTRSRYPALVSYLVSVLHYAVTLTRVYPTLSRIIDYYFASPQGVYEDYAAFVMDSVANLGMPVKAAGKILGMNSIGAFLRDWKKTATGASDLWQAVTDFGKGLFNKVSEAIGVNDLFYFHSSHAELDEWMSDASKLCQLAVAKPPNYATIESAKGLYRIGISYAARTLPSEVKEPFTRLLNELKRYAYNPMVNCGGYHKMEPLVVLFNGDPGVGKTHVGQHILERVVNFPGAFSSEARDAFRKDSSALAFVMNSEVKYETGTSENHEILLLDEFKAQVQPSEGVDECMRILRLANDLASYSEQASIENKGTKHNYKLIFIFCNLKNFSAQTLIDPRAFWRRLDAIFTVGPAAPDYVYDAARGSLRHLIRDPLTGDVTGTEPIRPSPGYEGFNTQANAFGLVKGTVSGHTATLSDDGNVGHPVAHLNFDSICNWIGAALVQKREKYAKSVADLDTTRQAAVDDYDANDFPIDALTEAQRAVLNDPVRLRTWAERITLRMNTMGYEPQPVVIQELGQHRIAAIMKLDSTPHVQASYAAELIKLAVLDHQSERRLNASARTYLSQMAVACSRLSARAMLFMKKLWPWFAWAAAVALLAGATIALAPVIKSIIPDSVARMFISSEVAQTQSLHPGLADPRNLAWLRQQMPTVGPQGTIDITKQSVKKKLMKHRWVQILPGTSPLKTAASFQGVFGHIFLVNRHNIAAWIAAGHNTPGTYITLVKCQNYSSKGPVKGISIDLHRMIETAYDVPYVSDIMAVHLPQLSPAADMRHFFFPDQFCTAHVGPEMAYSLLTWREGVFNEFSGTAARVANLTVPTGTGNDIIPTIAYVADVHLGDCMSPLLINDVTTQSHKILGFHVAGNQQLGFSEYVSKESIDAVFAHFGPTIVSYEEAVPQGKPVFAETGLPVAYIIDPPPTLNRASDLQFSPLAQFAKTSRLPAQMHCRGSHDPIAEIHNGMLNVRPTGDTDLLQRCVKAYFAFYGTLSTRLPRTSVLSFDQVVVGEPHLHLAGIPRDTYAGYHLREGFEGTTHELALLRAQGGRFPYLNKAADNYHHAPLLDRLIHDVQETVAKFSKGIVYVHPVTVFGKSELRSIVDGKPKAPRGIYAMSLTDHIVQKMYFGSFMADYISKRLVGMHTLGINANGDDMDVIARSLQGLPILAGDLKKCDKTLFAMLADFIVQEMEETHYKKASDWEPAHAVARRCCMATVFNGVVTCPVTDELRPRLAEAMLATSALLGEPYPETVPSHVLLDCDRNMTGSSVTAMITDLSAKCAIIYGYARILQSFNYPVELFLNNISRYLKIFTNGDDNLIGLLPDAPRFNPIMFQRALAEWGLEYTSAEKDADLDWQSFKDVTYLKRKLVKHEVYHRFAGALDIGVIRDLPLFLKKGAGPMMTQVEMRCSLALAFASSHPREVYEETASWLSDIYEKAFGRPYIASDYVSAAKVASKMIDQLGVHFVDDVEHGHWQSALPGTVNQPLDQVDVKEGIEVDSQSAISVSAQQPESVLKNFMHKQIKLWNGTVTDSSVAGLVTSFDPIATYFAKNTMALNSLLPFQGISGVFVCEARVAYAAYNSGKGSLRHDPLANIWYNKMGAIPAGWTGPGEASRLPGVSGQFACHTLFRLRMPFMCPYSNYDLNGNIPNQPGIGQVYFVLEDVPYNGPSNAISISVAIFGYWESFELGPYTPLNTGTPIATYHRAFVPYTEADLDGDVGEYQSRAMGQASSSLSNLGTGLMAGSLAMTKFGLGYAGLSMAAGAVAKLTSAVVGAAATGLSLLGFSHKEIKDTMYMAPATNYVQVNTDTAPPSVSFTFNKNFGESAKSPEPGDFLDVEKSAELPVLFPGLGFNITTITVPFTTLRTFIVHPFYIEPTASWGGVTVQSIPSMAGLAVGTHNLWGVQHMLIHIDYTGPNLVSGQLRFVYYYWFDARSTALVYSPGLAEAACVYDLDVSKRRELDLIIEIPMPMPWISTQFPLGQVDVQLINQLSTVIGTPTGGSFQFKIGWLGLRVAQPIGVATVPVMITSPLAHRHRENSEPKTHRAADRQYRRRPPGPLDKASDSIKQAYGHYQSDTTAACEGVVRISAGPSIPHEVADLCAERNRSFRNFFKTRRNFSTGTANAQYYYFNPKWVRYAYGRTSDGAYTVAAGCGGVAPPDVTDVLLSGFDYHKGTRYFTMASNTQTLGAAGSEIASEYASANGLLDLPPYSETLTSITAMTQRWFPHGSASGYQLGLAVAWNPNSPIPWRPHLPYTGQNALPRPNSYETDTVLKIGLASGANTVSFDTYWGNDFDVMGYRGLSPYYRTANARIAPNLPRQPSRIVPLIAQIPPPEPDLKPKSTASSENRSPSLTNSIPTVSLPYRI